MQARIAISCGGTGGHIAPALALAELAAARFGRESVHFLCTGNEVERAMLGNAGYAFTELPVSRPRATLRSKATTVITSALAVPAARRALKQFGARGLVCAGGYASLPGALAASLLRLPVVALESNAVPGKVTRTVSRFANVCYAHIPLTQALACPVEVRGNPVRQAFLTPPTAAEARQALGLEPSLPTLLIIGGSQGAQAVNDAAIAAAPQIAALSRPLNVLHLTGPGDTARAEDAWKAAGVPYRVAPFTHNTATWMAASDLALCRAGAASIAELLVTGVPMLLVPYPAAADDHQRANAHWVAAADAGVVVPQETLTAARVTELVQNLLLNETARKAGRAAALAAANPGAGSDILHGILREFGISEDREAADSRRRAA